jgi:hypothetical protein
MNAPTRSTFALLLAAALAMSSMQASHAGVISTEQYLRALDREARIEQIDAVLARAEVREQLEHFGVASEEAGERVAALTDQELELLAANLEQLPAGGDLLGVAGIVFLVLLILELVGVIDIFNKI